MRWMISEDTIMCLQEQVLTPQQPFPPTTEDLATFILPCPPHPYQSSPAPQNCFSSSTAPFTKPYSNPLHKPNFNHHYTSPKSPNLTQTPH